MPKYALILLIMLTCFRGLSQTTTVSGIVTDILKNPVQAVEISIGHGNKKKIKTATDTNGHFVISFADTGLYYINIGGHGFENYTDSIQLRGTIVLDTIVLVPVVHMLDEVSVVEKVLAMVQKDDTIEYNSGAFKVNPDADAADLVKKMPAIMVNGKSITAQGETVIKVLVDGKPFFGTDPYASLKNLPADIIDKVQVYNEKSEQERFTGFREGTTSKTINIITKPGKRKGVFGNVYGGYGKALPRGNEPSPYEGMYGTGATINQFNGDRRITLTTQLNNLNAQNFTSGAESGGGGQAGISETKAAGLNYSDSWGKNFEITAGYFFNQTNTTTQRSLQKTYVLTNDSGQVYNEYSPSSSQSNNHSFNLRTNFTIDSLNSILFTPNFSIGSNDAYSMRTGSTRESSAPVNQLSDTLNNKNTAYNFNGNLLFRHRFRTKGRTLSLNINGGNNSSDGTALHTAQSLYYASDSLNDTLNQRTLQLQNTWRVSGNVTYTEPVLKNCMLKAEYNVSYLPAHSERNTWDYDYTGNTYTLQNDQYSNTFYSNTTTHKAGGSLQVRGKSSDFSLGLNYQLTHLSNDQVLPYKYLLNQDFRNLLPVATLQHRFSKTSQLHLSYNTNTQVPSVSQLQEVVVNTDPLHLRTGNPALKQPYQHYLMARFNTTGKGGKNNFFVFINGGYTQHYITSNSTIATHDTTIGSNIVLARGSQLTMPVNIDGYSTLTGNINYGLPLNWMKCRLGIGLNAGITNVPSVINNEQNYQHNKNGGIGITLSSNISERIDFMISSNTNVVANENSLNKQLNNTFVNQSTRASINLIIWKGIVFNTSISIQSNSGLSAAFNQNYALWNMSIGKKLFKKQQGDIRLTGFDLLNENSNIQHSVTDVYIQDSRSNMLQRYFLLVFTYKIRTFSKSGGEPAGGAELAPVHN